MGFSSEPHSSLMDGKSVSARSSKHLKEDGTPWEMLTESCGLVMVSWEPVLVGN